MTLNIAVTTTAKKIRPVDIPVLNDETPLFWWRNHYNLHAWMWNLYCSKKGRDRYHQVCCVRLDAADLDMLEGAIRAGLIPVRQGTAYRGDVEEPADDYRFLALAREAIAQGRFIRFTSW